LAFFALLAILALKMDVAEISALSGTVVQWLRRRPAGAVQPYGNLILSQSPAVL
jgi:hypothetical protein